MSRPLEDPDWVVALPSHEDSADALDAFGPEQSPDDARSGDAPHATAPDPRPRAIAAASESPRVAKVIPIPARPHLVVARPSPTRWANQALQLVASTTTQLAQRAQRTTQTTAVLVSRYRPAAIGAVVVAAVALVLVAMRFTATAPTSGRLGIDAASVPELPVAPP